MGKKVKVISLPSLFLEDDGMTALRTEIRLQMGFTE